MGIISHDAIIITTFADHATKLRADLFRIAAKHGGFECLISPVISGATNGYVSILVAPDGSKEGWGTSHQGDEMRAEILELLDDQRRYSEWVAVQFGECGTRITAAEPPVGTEY